MTRPTRMDEESRMRQIFAERLKDSRLRKGLTPIALSKDLDCTRMDIHNYEAARSIPRAAMMVRIADALNETVDWFLGRY